jgi:hypothetical protein
MEARRTSCGSAEEVEGGVDSIDAHVPRRDSGIRNREPASGTVLTSERATLPPPGRGRHTDPSIHVARIRLHTSMDELLYRLAVGDWEGAYRANVELVHLVPHVVAPRSEIEATELDYLQEYVLACVDGQSTWGDLVSGAPFEPAETLRALSALVDLGLVGCL